MKLLEMYDTVQGEGPNVGEPTTFIRFAGCNMRCPGWPCDTPYSIYPEQWRQEYKEQTPVQIIRQVELKHVCITGGEPLLQHRDQMHELMSLLWENGHTFDIFTNGSRNFSYYPLLSDAVSTIVMDWKLAGSGEGHHYLPERHENLQRLKGKDAVKFVVKDRNDLHQAKATIEVLPKPFSPRVYIGPAWDLIDPAEIVEFILDYKLPAYLNLQTHKYVWPNKDRGI